MKHLHRVFSTLNDPKAIDFYRLILEAIAAIGTLHETKALWFKLVLASWFTVDLIAAVVAFRSNKRE